jgi:hypothetical protein
MTRHGARVRIACEGGRAEPVRGHFNQQPRRWPVQRRLPQAMPAEERLT